MEIFGKIIFQYGNRFPFSILVKINMRNRIKELREKNGWTQGQLADAAGTSTPQIQRLESGTRKLTQDWMDRLAKALNAKTSDLLPEEALEGYSRDERGESLPAILDLGGHEYGAIGVYDARASAGPGALNADYPEPEGYRIFPLSWLRSITAANPEALAILTVAGDSMEPTLENGDQILIDRSVRYLGRDGLYVLSADNDTQVKRLSRDPRDRTVTISSDNPKAKSWSGVDEEMVHVLGRVLWLGRKVEG